jgi:hypothetical protein
MGYRTMGFQINMVISNQLKPKFWNHPFVALRQALELGFSNTSLAGADYSTDNIKDAAGEKDWDIILRTFIHRKRKFRHCVSYIIDTPEY